MLERKIAYEHSSCFERSFLTLLQNFYQNLHELVLDVVSSYQALKTLFCIQYMERLYELHLRGTKRHDVGSYIYF